MDVEDMARGEGRESRRTEGEAANFQYIQVEVGARSVSEARDGLVLCKQKVRMVWSIYSSKRKRTKKSLMGLDILTPAAMYKASEKCTMFL